MKYGEEDHPTPQLTCDKPRCNHPVKNSDMVLWVHSDASYLFYPKARSRAGGMHLLSDKPPSPNNTADLEPTLNGIVYVVCKILCNIMASAAEAELGDLFLNCQKAVPILITLKEMGHY